MEEILIYVERLISTKAFFFCNSHTITNFSAKTEGGGRVLKWARFVRRIIFLRVDFRSYVDWLGRRRYFLNVIWRRTAMKIKDCRTNYIRFISKLWCAWGSKWNFWSRDRFKPRRRPRDLEDHFMVYIQMVMTTEKSTKLGHDQACFVVCWFSTIFQQKFSHKTWQIGRTEVNETQGYAISWYNSIFHSLRRRRSTLVLMGTTIPWLYVIIIARPHQNCTKCVFQDKFWGLFVEPKCSYGLLVASGEIPKWELRR